MRIGEKYNCWTVLSFVGKSKVIVQCDCGAQSTLRKYDVENRRTNMCKACAISVSKKGHGHATKGNVSPEYTSYTHMIQRCTNPSNKDYPNYGGRGIKVCDMWLDSYEAFFMCMGPKPSPDYTIERKECNKDYEPGNCIWADVTTQNRNRRNTHMITHNDKTQALSAWIAELGLELSADAIYKRINRGMDPKEAMLKNVKHREKK